MDEREYTRQILRKKRRRQKEDEEEGEEREGGRERGKKGESERGQEETSIAILDQEILRPKKTLFQIKRVII